MDFQGGGDRNSRGNILLTLYSNMNAANWNSSYLFSCSVCILCFCYSCKVLIALLPQYKMRFYNIGLFFIYDRARAQCTFRFRNSPVNKHAAMRHS